MSDNAALTETAKLNDVDPQAWLADVLARLPDHPAKHLDELLPWNWKADRTAAALAQAASRGSPDLRCWPDAYVPAAPGATAA